LHQPLQHLGRVGQRTGLVQEERQRAVRRCDAVVPHRHVGVLRERPGERREHQHRIGTRGLGVIDMALRLQAVFGVDATHQQRVRRAGLPRNLGHAALLVATEHEVLARVAVDQQTGDAVGTRHGRQVRRQRVFVDAAIALQRAHGGGMDAAEMIEGLGGHGGTR
jgi:hypothetical protein